jgi:hypothetical protein
MRWLRIMWLSGICIASLGVSVFADPTPAATQPSAPAATAGGLEFHVLVFDRSDPAFKAMSDRMKPGGVGPAPQAGDETYRWFEVAHADAFDLRGQPAQTVEWAGKHYLPVLITPGASMTGEKPWSIAPVFTTTDSTGAPIIEFVFDVRGKELFSDLTTRFQPHDGRFYQLAIVLDGKILSAPRLLDPITGGSVMLQGGAKGWTPEDQQLIVEQLRRARP